MKTRGCLVLLMLFPIAATAADRGPSTPEERSQAIAYIHHFQADPLNPKLQGEIQWVVKWTMEVPDIRLDLCTSFYRMPKARTKDGSILFDARVFAQTAFALENPARQDDGLAQVEAGVDGVLSTYERLLQVNAKDREPFLDKLIKLRDEGTLADYVKQHVPSACGN